MRKTGDSHGGPVVSADGLNHRLTAVTPAGVSILTAAPGDELAARGDVFAARPPKD
jgi:hypothetical protein